MDNTLLMPDQNMQYFVSFAHSGHVRLVFEFESTDNYYFEKLFPDLEIYIWGVGYPSLKDYILDENSSQPQRI